MSSAIVGNGPVIRESRRFVIHWFRHRDLRLHDNTALIHSDVLSKEAKCPVIPVFCFDKKIFGDANRVPLSNSLKCGVRRAKFILESVSDLRQQLQSRLKSHLLVTLDEPTHFFDLLLRELKEHEEQKSELETKLQLDATIVCQDEVVREERLTAFRVTKVLRRHSSDKMKIVEQVWGSTLYMPKKMSMNLNFSDMPNGFDDFRHKIRKNKIEECRPRPDHLPFPVGFESKAMTYMPSLSDLGYTDEQIALSETVDPRSNFNLFVGGETAGLKRVQEYIWDLDLLRDWAKMRNLQILQNKSSKLSPWLAHGCVSPRVIAAEAKRYHSIRRAGKGNVIVQTELTLRDYCKFFCVKHGDGIFQKTGAIPPKRRDVKPKLFLRGDADFELWKEGKTGYPLVDASMRELKTTGYISNRCRLNAASFLVNDMKHDWRRGAQYFEEQLVDYDVYLNWWVRIYFVRIMARRKFCLGTIFLILPNDHNLPRFSVLVRCR
jgi:deoxyribodipyrimidine photo-lyase